MQYTRLGNSSLKVSRIGLGAMGIGDPSWRPWVLTHDAARPLVMKAVELGINFFDTCDFYSGGESEQVLGKLLNEVAIRDEVVIATKLGNPMGASINERGYSRKHIISAVDASLRRLGVDYIDLCQTHIWDPATNIEEMMTAFDDLVRSGKVLYIGATDLPVWQLAKAHYTARAAGKTGFTSAQHHYNLVWREDERELLTMCETEGIGLLPYSPLARGFLVGYERGTVREQTDEYTGQWYGRVSDQAVLEAVAKVAARTGLTNAQVALRWVLQKSSTSAPIIGATTVQHIEEAVSVLDTALDEQAMTQLESAYEPRIRAGH